MKSIEKDIEYMEGTWAGKVLVQHLGDSTYGNLEVAIGVKETVVKSLKKSLGIVEICLSLIETMHLT